MTCPPQANRPTIRFGSYMKAKALRLTFFCALGSMPAIALLHVAQAHHASLVLSHWIKGKAANCSLAEAFESEALSRLEKENIDQLRVSSKAVRKDDRY